MTSTQKGNKFEIEVKKHLESKGWTVFRQHRKPIYIKGKIIMVGADIFGCDLVAKKEGCKTLWIQVTTLVNKSTKEAVFKKYPWTLKYETPQLWCRIEGHKIYKVFEYPHRKPIYINGKIINNGEK